MFMGEDDGRDEDLWIQEIVNRERSGDDGREGGCIAALAVLCFSAMIVGAVVTGFRWGWW